MDMELKNNEQSIKKRNTIALDKLFNVRRGICICRTLFAERINNLGVTADFVISCFKIHTNVCKFCGVDFTIMVLMLLDFMQINLIFF